MQRLDGKHILVGITGSVAAYKSAELIRALTDAGASVEAAMTPSAQRFLGKATVQALTGKPPILDMFAGDGNPDGMDHIAAVRRADVMAIAPATASTIARLAAGLADDPVAALACAADCPVLVAPAMNREMWANPAVQRSVKALEQDGKTVINPEAGELACGEHGSGRLADPMTIAAAIAAAAGAHGPLAGRTALVSTGATAERIDSMRVIANRSSGRMGHAVAAALRAAGAQVRLVAGRTEAPPPDGMASVTVVESAAQMLQAVQEQARGADLFVSVAAVSDYRPVKPSAGKIPRRDGNVTLELEPCPDIVASVAALDHGPLCVAFAAEDGGQEEAVKAARAKMAAKGVQAIVASPIQANVGGEDCDLTYIGAKGEFALGPQSKRSAAEKIAELMASDLADRK